MGNPCLGLENVVAVINTSRPNETEFKVQRSHLHLKSCAASFLNCVTWLLFLGLGLTRFCIFLFSLRSRRLRTLEQYAAPDVPNWGRHELTQGKGKPFSFPHVNCFRLPSHQAPQSENGKWRFVLLISCNNNASGDFLRCSFQLYKVIVTIVVDLFMK